MFGADYVHISRLRKSGLLQLSLNISQCQLPRHTHTFGRLRCQQEMGDYYRDFKGGREQRYSKSTSTEGLHSFRFALSLRRCFSTRVIGWMKGSVHTACMDRFVLPDAMTFLDDQVSLVTSYLSVVITLLT
jgi:hypothetical protein